MHFVTNTVDNGPTAGGDAPVTVYAADTVITLPTATTLLQVAGELAGDQIGLVVLGALDHVDGVISERDIVRAVAQGHDPATTPARDMASTRIVWCDATATVHEVAEQMMEEYVRHVLLEDEGQLVGIVSARDLLGAYTMAPD